MKATLHYTIIQGCYWSTYCMMFNYAASYLEEKGFSASRIGLTLGACYALSALLQPLYASFVERRRLNPARAIACVYVAVCLASLALLLPVSGALTAVLFITALTLQSSMQSSVNALAHSIDSPEDRVNYSLARGLGSASFSLTSLFVGFLLRRMSCRLIPVLYAFTALTLCLFAFLAQRRAVSAADTPSEKRGSITGILEHKTFVIFLIGGVLCLSAQMFLDSFMLKIMENVGGSNTELGIAFAIASGTELPAMIVYGRLRKRLSCAFLIGLSGCFWLVKHVLTIFAPSPSVLYLCQLLQFVCYAFYVPAGVEFAGLVLPEELYMQGQAFLGTAFALGCLPATLLGGSLLDAIGLRPTLIFFALIMTLGVSMFIIAARRSIRKI